MNRRLYMLDSNATPRMVQRHYWSRDCRPLRELIVLGHFVRHEINNKIKTSGRYSDEYRSRKQGKACEEI